MTHQAVRETLAQRLGELQTEVVAAEATARRSREQAQKDYETWQSLRDEKQAVQQFLADEVATPPTTPPPASEQPSPDGSTPAPRAQTYPEGETPPPAERAPSA
jgi:hypothetical protein